MMQSTKRLSIIQVAELLNTTPLNVLMHIKRGLLQGIEEDGDWQVERASLEALQAKTGGARATEVCASGCSGKHGCSSGCG